MPLVLLDLDGVVATNAAGQDCRRGDQVYLASATFDPSALVFSRTGPKLVILTHRSRSDALEILSAVGLEGDVPPVVSASDLLRESLRFAIQRRRFQGLAKAGSLRILKRDYGWTDASSTALIDDQEHNLVSMIESGVIQWGIRAPRATIHRDGSVSGLDLATAYGWAARLVTDGASCIGGPLGPPHQRTPVKVASGVSVGQEGSVWQAPLCEGHLDSLRTGSVFQGSIGDPVTLLRHAKAALRRARIYR